MQNNYTSLYMLSSFTAHNITQLKDVVFSVNFNDGFIVWINGEEVFSVNAPTSVTYQSEATSQNDYGTSHTYLDYNPWPLQPDGDGPSLSAAVSYPTGDPNDASYWKASSSYDGTPFADDKGIVASMDDPMNDQL